MDTNQLIEKLMCFGMTRQEATLYLCLAQNGELTGYEAAKQTGISRSNAYNALAGLVDKGAAYTVEGTAVKYHAIDIEEFCANKIRALEEMKSQLQVYMPKPKSEAEGYLTITGDKHIRDKVKNMLTQSKQRVYISMTENCIRIFEKEIKSVIAEGKKVVILTDAPMDIQGAILYRTENKGRQIGVITDSTNVLTGEIGKGEESTCLYSGQPNFVQVFKDSMRNEIKLIELLKGEKQ
ncbi:MAG: TrmB family transcriptional regulator [Lachnospiraceae bacterium]|nr:TrmB family transcriptional regulator [Lachnospiraceae bacterium]